MRCVETLTASGTGFWGPNYELELVRNTVVYASRYEDRERIEVSYGLRFKQPPDSTWGGRSFKSEAERSAFLKGSFTELALEEWKEERPCDSVVAGVVGEYLSAVTFVMDYLQIDFSGHTFNLYRWPTVSIAGRAMHRQSPGYRDALCSLIGKALLLVDEYLDAGLVFDFQDECSLELSLKAGEDLPTGEVAGYRSVDGTLVVFYAEDAEV